MIGSSPETGVIYGRHRAYSYQNLLICDGSSVPSSPGVNPSLTITALTEYAMEAIPAKERARTEGTAPLFADPSVDRASS